MTDEKLDGILFAIRTSVQASTNVSPFEMMYVRKPLLPVDLDMSIIIGKDPDENLDNYSNVIYERLQQIRDQLSHCAATNISKSQKRQKANFDKRKQIKKEIPIGTSVMLNKQ